MTPEETKRVRSRENKRDYLLGLPIPFYRFLILYSGIPRRIGSAIHLRIVATQSQTSPDAGRRYVASLGSSPIATSVWTNHAAFSPRGILSSGNQHSSSPRETT